MIKKSDPATKSPRFRRFITERDRALEVMLSNATARSTDVLNKTFRRVLEIVSHQYGQLPDDGILSGRSRHTLYNIEVAIDSLFADTVKELASIAQKLNKHAYLLAFVGMSEALGRARDQKQKYNVHKYGEHDTAFSGEPIEARFSHSFLRLRMQLIQALSLARVHEEKLPDALKRVKKALPKVALVKRNKPILKRMTREADLPSDVAEPLSFGFLDEKEWASLVDDYKNEYVPKTRSPETVFDVPEDGSYFEKYGWEVEQEITNNFVSQVRSGDIDSAKENGISDFQWIAIIDRVTDECCLWRDGLTTAEIEAKLQSEHADDECDVMVPPAHFNCRCTIAPMLDDMPEKPESNEQEFDQWLNS